MRARATTVDVHRVRLVLADEQALVEFGGEGVDGAGDVGVGLELGLPDLLLAAPVGPPVGDWLVVPSPPVERGWRWARIVARIPGDGPVRFRVRWVGNDRDSVVTPPPGYRIESAARWPHAPSSAIGLWPHPTDEGQVAREQG